MSPDDLVSFFLYKNLNVVENAFDGIMLDPLRFGLGHCHTLDKRLYMLLRTCFPVRKFLKQKEKNILETKGILLKPPLKNKNRLFKRINFAIKNLT